MELKKLAGAVAATTVMFSIGAVAPASAADNQAFGIQQSVTDANGGEIAYTVTKLLPSGDAVPYPLSGQLYEVTVRANAMNGIVTPAVPNFSALTESGQSYPALAGAWTPLGFNSAPLLPGGSSTGKIYFDAVGEPPTGVAYNGAGQSLSWIEPPAASEEEVATEEEAAPAEEAAPEEGASEESGAPAESESADSGAADAEANGDVAAASEEEE
ncbi:DUF1942 domain-containing protein [Mycolicibacterium stellerae]|uniref:DUF1942 domain-containing protein n=1 Tax=Mycolicibacterium stellerae TaxID=2358193 RepID=UPI000F0B4F91|nr:DUF1942 domain-containing protein [Mycolicibacterium stellerae]